VIELGWTEQTALVRAVDAGAVLMRPGARTSTELTAVQLRPLGRLALSADARGQTSVRGG
jgi:hypothetical protein